MKRTLSSLAALAVLGSIPAMGQVVLTDANSMANINPASSAGMDTWQVDGIDHMFQQWFWFRIGASGGEASIDTISAANVLTVGTNFAKLTYTNNVIKVETTYILTGGANGSSQADITESIRVTNMDVDPNNFHFFQYTDFDMGGTATGDTVVHVNANTFDQFDGFFGSSETISTPVANHWEAGPWPGIVSNLSDPNPTTLGDFGSGSTGDVAFAWQWDFQLNPGQSFLISKDKNITPEPATFVTLGLGLAGLLAARRRR